MYLQFYDDLIPGTKLKRSDMDGLTGQAFLKKVFFVSDGVMLTQIRDISGIDSSTLQNWTKRGWVANSHLKRYGPGCTYSDYQYVALLYAVGPDCVSDSVRQR